MSRYEEMFDSMLQSAGFVRDRDYYREYPTPNGYTLDFYFPQENLCFEIDGIHHRTPVRVIRDKRRDESMMRYGIRTLRIDTDLLEKRGNLVLSLVLKNIRYARTGLGKAGQGR